MTGNASLQLGSLLAEGKTKRILQCSSDDHLVYLQSKDSITANNAQRRSEMTDKGIIATETCTHIFQLLQKLGVKTALVERAADNTMLCHRCDMIPIEWVTRRIATGSFLKRNPGVEEGFRFTPPKLETFYKDDEAGDPQWSEQQILEARMTVGKLEIDCRQVALMSAITVAVFEILEKMWRTKAVTLVDMKIEFGVSSKTGEIILADVIDNDSWRLWPNGDKRLQRDKQVFRDAEDLTEEVMKNLKTNYEWVARQLSTPLEVKPHKVVIMMGSPADKEHCAKIRSHLTLLGLDCDVRVTSAHKATCSTLQMVAEYEGRNIALVFIAVAGRSNGLGPVLSGNTDFPVINCPPPSVAGVVETDVWSSLRTPSGLGCSTVLYPEAAALAAATIIASADSAIWCRLRAKRLNNWTRLLYADIEATNIQA